MDETNESRREGDAEAAEGGADQPLATGDPSPGLATFVAAASELAERVRASVAEIRPPGGGAGAGTIWRSDGTLVTNSHVAARDVADVVLPDGRRFSASVVAREQRQDLAVLKIDADSLPAISLGDARRLRVGELVLAVGHPFGIRGAVTVGVVSTAPSRDPAAQGRELVRADVLLGPGNSGGPLVDARGRVVGINAMVAGGLALAVPSYLAEQLVASPWERPSLGIAARDVELSPWLAARAPSTSGRAALIVGLRPGGPGQRAGLQVGDLLVALDGQPLEGVDGLLNALANRAGAAIRLAVLRGGVPREIVVLPRRPERRAA